MGRVQTGKVWEINNVEDFFMAMASLDDSEFIAEMSDSYAWTVSEKAEIEKQRVDIIHQAKEKGIVREVG